MQKQRQGFLIVFVMGLLLFYVGYSIYNAHREKFASALDIIAYSPGNLNTGTSAAARVIVMNRKNLQPIGQAELSLSLKNRRTGEQQTLFKGKTNQRGSADIRFTVPPVAEAEGKAAGHTGMTKENYDMRVKVCAGIGDGELVVPVTIEKKYRILLTTDKPVYQPGQTIHIRTLLFNGPSDRGSRCDEKPSGQEKVKLEMYEPKGYKVFQQELETCSYGIGSAAFTLGKEIREGTYRIKAAIGKYVKTKRIRVETYVLPKFKVECHTGKSWYFPGETVTGAVKALYYFGKPVDRAEVKLNISRGENAAKSFAEIHGTTDSRGIYTFTYQAGGANNILGITVRDKARHREQTSLTVPISAERLRIELYPESGVPKRGLENILYVVTTYPDGNPAACKVTINKHIHLQTNRWGIGEARIFFQIYNKIALEVKAEDNRGNKVKEHKEFHESRYSIESLILRTDKVLYQPGEAARLQILSTEKEGSVYVDVLKNGQVVFTGETGLKKGKALLEMPIGEEMKGTLTCCARLMIRNSSFFLGKYTLWDMKQVVVQPPRENEVNVVIKSDKNRYLPGEEAIINFTTSRGDHRCPAALGVTIVDESVSAITPADNDDEVSRFILGLNKVNTEAQHAGITLPHLLREKKSGITPTAAEKQQIARVLLASENSRLERGFIFNETSRYTRKMWEVAAKKRDFQIFQVYFLFLQALLMIIILVFFTRKNREQEKGDKTKEVGNTGQGKLLPDLCFAFNAIIIQFMGVMLAAVLLESVSHPGILGKMMSWVLRLIPLAITIIMAVHYSGKKAFNAFYGWYYAANLVVTVVVVSYCFHDGYGTPLLFRVMISILLTTLIAISAIPFLVYSVKNRQNHLTWSLAIYSLYLVTLYGLLGGGDNGFSMGISISTILALLLPPAVLLVFVIRLVRAGNKIAVPLTTVILLSWLIPFLLTAHRESKSLELYSYTEQQPGMYSMDLGTMWAQRGVTLLPEIPPRPGPPRSKQKEPAETPEMPGELPCFKLRQFFPETLYVNHCLVTDEKGQAALPVKMADNITQWRLSALAHTPEGAMGTGETLLPVFQDFFLDINMPTHLTQGDEIDLPVAIYNYLPTPQEVKITLPTGQENNWYDVVRERERTLALKPNEAAGVYFRIKAREAGTHRYTVYARSSGISDAMAREVKVVPAGKEIHNTWNARLRTQISREIMVPPAATANSEKLVVKIYPGQAAQLPEGMEAMLQMPYGCFEQTVSITYPNIMVLQYLQKTGRPTPAIEKKARTYISRGYQRLLTFETRTGGYSWYGRGEGKILLTAYGLLLLTDMVKVYPIDIQVLSRVRQWLFSRLQGDHWQSDCEYGGICCGRQDSFAATAFVTWALLYSGVKPDDLRIKKILEFLEKNDRTHRSSSAVLGIYALVLLKAGKDAQPILGELARKQKQDYRGVYWTAESQGEEGETIDNTVKTGTTAETAEMTEADDPGLAMNISTGTIETTAWVAMAYIKAGNAPLEVARTLRFLAGAKKSAGHWGSTQATVLALKALTAAYSRDTQPVRGTLRVSIDNQPIKEVQIGKENNDMLHLLDFSQYARKGESEINITFQGRGEMYCQIDSSYNLDWHDLPAPGKPGTQPLHLEVKPDRTRLKQGETLTVEVVTGYTGQGVIANAIINLGLPPGFRLYTEDIEAVKTQGLIERYESDGDRLILYVSDLGKQGVCFQYRLKALTAARVMMPSSRVYDYYRPRLQAEVKPLQLLVMPAF